MSPPTMRDQALLGAAGVSGCVEATFNQSLTNTARTIGYSRIAGGVRPESGHVLREKLIKSVTLRLDTDGRSPDQTITVNVRGDDASFVDTIGTADASTLVPYSALDPIDTNEVTFDTTAVLLGTDDLITLEYPVGSGEDAIQTRIYNSTNITANLTPRMKASTPVTGSWIDWRETYAPDYFWSTMWMRVVYCE